MSLSSLGEKGELWGPLVPLERKELWGPFIPLNRYGELLGPLVPQERWGSLRAPKFTCQDDGISGPYVPQQRWELCGPAKIGGALGAPYFLWGEERLGEP